MKLKGVKGIYKKKNKNAYFKYNKSLAKAAYKQKRSLELKSVQTILNNEAFVVSRCAYTV